MKNIKFGLCCKFLEYDIKFKTTTITHLKKFDRHTQLCKLSELCLHNINMLNDSIDYCINNRIGAFRIGSHIFPCATHPELGYHIDDLNIKNEIYNISNIIKDKSKNNNIRLIFHPDQFVVLNSPTDDIVQKSIIDIEHHTILAILFGVDVINIHAGGVYNDKTSALNRFKKSFELLSDNAKSLLTIENDDKSYNPTDLLPICNELNIPLLYDVHHHRCYSDNLSIIEATDKAIETWKNKEPVFHISSPKEVIENKICRPHADYININDFPDYWKNLNINFTIEIEAKAKELAIKKLITELGIEHEK